MAQQSNNNSPNLTLAVDFSWRNLRARITDKNDSEQKSLYFVDFKTFKPNLVFKRGNEEESKFATGTLHSVSINADCEIGGKPIQLKARKRFHTEYMHQSLTYPNTAAPVPLSWTSDADFKTWDFICLDPQQNPVAKFSTNVWATKKVGNIEFMGPKGAVDKAFIDEIVVTGLTLWNCMALRTMSILSFFGALFSRPGPIEQEMPKGSSEYASSGDRNQSDAKGAATSTKLTTG
jgi:hypothetical protein